ncbi:MAG: hypothetical protein M1823_001832 [Watsoniomyces obsoletus]|nr:MAG: hypothetical protein M1823_001832 [Watsoniomyces obsoletus]
MTIATAPSVSTLLETLSASLDSAVSALPEASALKPSKDGISLLDVKNELFFSYLQHLVFLIIFKLRHARGVQTKHPKSGDDEKAQSEDENEEETDVNEEDIVKKLVEYRVFLERGVRPLEGRLKYQLDKVLRAADDAERNKGAENTNGNTRHSKDEHEAAQLDERENENLSEEEDENGADAATRLSGLEIDDLSYRPNPASLINQARGGSAAVGTTAGKPASDGIYRPPRITPTAPPTTTGPDEKNGRRRPHKSAILDEFIATELSTAPVMEPSIGSTVVAGGRRTKSARERKAEAERRDYEEANFVRLPKESKKERAAAAKQRRAAGDDPRGGGYGGEEWRGLGEGLDRIERLTAKRNAPGRELLERSRKRERESATAPADAAVATRAGERMEKRRKVLGKRNRTKADYE